jgi:mannose-1-phosphate guanylyltransferase/mannose-6-phosphate isomerase
MAGPNPAKTLQGSNPVAVFPVIMCGGSGTRLWPASRPSRPKQFVPLTSERSSFQDTVLRVMGLAGARRPLVVAGIAHRATILAQLAEIGVSADLLLEPEPRDSAAAMAAAAAWIFTADQEGVAAIVSADHHIPDAVAFRSAVSHAVEGARSGRLVTLGVRPTSPSSAYGYIRPAGTNGLQDVIAFVEKPDAATAARYMSNGYLWNSGNFVVSSKVLLEDLATHAGDVLRAVEVGLANSRSEGSVTTLGAGFCAAPKISIDYAVMEKTQRASVLAVDFEWSDVGAWDAVWEASAHDKVGNVLVGDGILLDTTNSYVRASSGRRVAVIGLSNVAVVADDEEILVCNLASSQSVKHAAERSKLCGPVQREFSSLADAAAWYDLWLKTNALPLWWSVGVDHVQGGFVEALSLTGEPRPAPRRGRVQGRQIYVFATAGCIGWAGPWRKALELGLDYAFDKFQRPDRLFRALVSVEGLPLDEGATIYDQAFALLGMAASHATGYRSARDLAAEACRIRAALGQMRHVGGGFREAGPHPFQSNCHMHLLEAALAWEEAGQADWGALADEIVELALTRFIDSDRGFLREFFDEAWLPAPGEDGRIVEPGHQFEWAWLLARWAMRRGDPRALQCARRLLDIGSAGVDERGVACNAIWEDLSVRDAEARLWPQTEHLKAALILGDEPAALRAANALHRYLETQARGTWFDRLRSDGSFVSEAAPASSLYHIICAIKELLTSTGMLDNASA